MSIQFGNVIASDKLPSLPQVAVRVMEIAQQPEPDFQEMIASIKTDPAICASILKTVNSPLFGFGHKISSIQAGVPILGANLVRTLVLSFSLARYRSPNSRLARYYQRHWRNSLTQAVTAERLASLSPSLDPNVFFTAGLLQDIGGLALLHTHGDEYVEKVLRGVNESCQLACEETNLGFTHVDVSVELCRNWGLEEELVQAIAEHHEPLPELDREVTNDDRTLNSALKVAARCSEHLSTLQGFALTDLSTLPPTLQRWYSMDQIATYGWLHEIDSNVEEFATMFLVDIGEMPPLDELLENAKSTLGDIAIQAHLDAAAAAKKAQEATRKVARFQEDAHRDALTEVYNRQFMSQVLASELEQRVEMGSDLGFLFLDVDKFKQVNDTYGHEAGDQALKLVAKILRESTRETDRVIRYGGDEFLVVLTGINKRQLRRIAKRICNHVRKTPVPSPKPLRISCSIGVFHCTPTAEIPVILDDVVRQVDEAMYDAKRQGGNQVQFHTTSKPAGAC